MNNCRSYNGVCGARNAGGFSDAEPAEETNACIHGRENLKHTIGDGWQMGRNGSNRVVSIRGVCTVRPSNIVYFLGSDKKYSDIFIFLKYSF